jgi:hypothetical protein
VVLVAVGATAPLAGVAEAQSDAAASGDDAAAHAEKGRWYMEREAWIQAVSEFERSLELELSVRVRFDLARALLESEQPRRAAEEVATVLRVARDPALEQAARQLRRRIHEEAGRVVIRVDTLPPGALVQLDDRPVPASQLGQELVVRPGLHVVTVLRGQDELKRREVDAFRGEVQVVRFELGAPKPRPDPIPAAPEEPRERTDDGGGIATGWIWGIAGVLVVGGLVTAVALTASGGVEDPIVGDFEPGVVTWD